MLMFPDGQFFYGNGAMGRKNVFGIKARVSDRSGNPGPAFGTTRNVYAEQCLVQPLRCEKIK